MADAFDKIIAKAHSIASDVDKAQLARELSRIVDRYVEKDNLFREARAVGLDPVAFIAALRNKRQGRDKGPESRF